MTWFSKKKCLFPLDANMVSCPTWSKNLGRTLFNMLAMIQHEIICWFLTIYKDLKSFAAQEHRIVFVLTFRCEKQFYVPKMQEQSKAGKKSEINRQRFVIWWLNSRKYRSVWYLLNFSFKLPWRSNDHWCWGTSKRQYI